MEWWNNGMAKLWKMNDRIFLLWTKVTMDWLNDGMMELWNDEMNEMWIFRMIEYWNNKIMEQLNYRMMNILDWWSWIDGMMKR